MPATDSATKWVENLFQSSIVPTLVDYIKIPNKSVMFDPEWRAHGFMDKANQFQTNQQEKILPEEVAVNGARPRAAAMRGAATVAAQDDEAGVGVPLVHDVGVAAGLDGDHAGSAVDLEQDRI